MFMPILLWLIFTTVAVRTANLPHLKDITTNDWTLGPDLDPFLYLRNAKEIEAGTLKNPDMMRYFPLGMTNYASYNMMPWAIFYLYKFLSVFGSSSITYAAIIAPVIFFIASLIGFFFFCTLILSFKFPKAKAYAGATIASFLYATIPQMLHRTVAGVPEIESLGMVWFWLAFVFYALAWKSEKKKSMILFSVLAGLFTGAMSWTWGGYRYIYMAIALTGFLLFLFNPKDKKNFVVFFSWFLAGLVFEFLRFRSLAPLFSYTDVGLGFFVSFILLVSFVLLKTGLKEKLRLDKLKLPESLASIFIGIILISLLLLIVKPAFLLNFASNFMNSLLYPYGNPALQTERVGFTVAENATPYFSEVFQNFGYLFWIFFFGAITLFYSATNHLKRREKWILNLFFIVFLCGFMFSKLSPDSSLNGTNFISEVMYLGGLLAFVIASIYVFMRSFRRGNSESFKKIGVSYILLISFALLAIISMRGAIRLFFIVSPFLIIIASYLPIRLLELAKNKGTKMVFLILFVVSVLFLVYIFIQYQSTTIANVTYGEVPSSYNYQWQKAMGWVRNDTPSDAVFAHWWDYGYWVQTLGERATVLDGANSYTYWDHTTGRYLLTTPKPETALSLMKTYGVSFLLIDSTDLGKYSAYSKIGSDLSGTDRFSWIPIMVSDSSQMQETANGTIRIYQGGSAIDEDITYDGNFFPAEKAAIIGIILESTNGGQVKQPYAVYYFNNKQVKIPIRYVEIAGQFIDFGSGLESTIKIIPNVYSSDKGVQIDQLGVAIYLSPKVSPGLFAQLYLLNDPFGLYPSIKIAHAEPDYVVENLNTQGANLPEFIYYQGFRGPIKIWKIDYPENIIERPEFLKTTGNYGDLDNLTFVK